MQTLNGRVQMVNDFVCDSISKEKKIIPEEEEAKWKKNSKRRLNFVNYSDQT